MMHLMLKHRLGTASLIAAALVCTVTTSFAQPPSPTPVPPSSSPSSPPDAATDERMAEARRQFEAGVSLLDDPDGAKYEDAHRAFKKAYELSRSPKVLGNIGFCALKLERDGEAIDAYSSYLREVPDIEERERVQIQRDLVTLTSTVARLKIVVKNPATTSTTLVDKRAQTRGEAVENAYAFQGNEHTLRLRPGRHTFKVKAGDQESAPLEVTLEPGAVASHELTLVTASQLNNNGDNREPSQRGGSRSLAGPIILGATGLAALGAGVVTGLMASGKTSDIEKACPNDLCPSTYDLASERTKAKTFGTVADISFIGGGVLLGGAILWYVLLPSGDAKKSKPTGAATTSSVTSWSSWSPAAMCTSDGCRMQLQRGF
jgi:hypothetical protein